MITHPTGASHSTSNKMMAVDSVTRPMTGPTVTFTPPKNSEQMSARMSTGSVASTGARTNPST